MTSSYMISSWTRRRVIDEFSGFPECIAHMIAEYCATAQLLSWIDKSHLNYESLCQNPKAIESGMIDINSRYGPYIVANPAAAEYIKSHIDDFIHEMYIWENPVLFDWLIINYPDRIEMEMIGLNTNPNAVKYMIDSGYENDISDDNFVAFEHFQKTGSRDISKLYGNAAATDYLGDFNGHGNELSSNSHPRAIEYLRTHQNEIN